MKYFLLILGLLTISNLQAQKISKIGKIDLEEIPTMADHDVRKVDGSYKIYTDSLDFDGNSYHKVPNGYITSLEVFDKNKDYVKQYDATGKLLVSIFSDRILNLKISDNGNRIAYYDSKNIILIDMVEYTADTLQGSLVYSFLKDNSFIYYDSELKTIYNKSYQVEIDSYPNQFVEFKNKLLVLNKKDIFELSAGSLINLHELRGQLYDAKVIGEEFYFIDKIEKRKKEAFTMYKTSDFKKFIIHDKKDELNR